MAFGFAGAAAGANQSLEEIVAQRILAQKLEQEIADRQQRADMEQQRFAETRKHNEWERTRAEGLDAERKAAAGKAADKASLADRGRSNMAGVVAMGVDPQTARKEIAFSSLQSGADIPSGVMDAIAPRKKEYTYTDPKTGAKSLRYADPDAIPEGGIDLGREPQKPERGPGPYVVNGNLVDANGRVIFSGGNANAVDPAKAREKGLSMLDAARSLRKHPGLGSLTGARIGNPDYALGVQNTPVAGTKAADAGAYFNQLKSLFTLDNIGLLKGVLSDTDMKILQQASTSLDTAMQDETFAAELDRVIQKLETAFGGGQANSLPPMDPTSSRGTGRTVDPRVDDLIKKYGGGGV